MPNFKGSSHAESTLLAGESANTSTRSDYVAPASLRFGYALNNVLLYGKGGLAVTSFKHHGGISVDSTGATLDLLDNSSSVPVGYVIHPYFVARRRTTRRRAG